MKDIKINAKVIENFNDKTKIVNGNPYTWEKGEIIHDIPRERFEELQSKGFVIEDKTKEDKKKSEWD